MTSDKKEENIILDVKVVKKRGRKPKNSLDTILKSQQKNEDENEKKGKDVKVPKKRGRKPKANKETSEPKVPKKRGRKPMLSHVVSTNKNLNENFITKDNVLHLKINSQEAENNIMLDSLYQYNPEINDPQPYDPVDNYAKTLENLENSLKNKYDNHNYVLDKNQNDVNPSDSNISIGKVLGEEEISGVSDTNQANLNTISNNQKLNSIDENLDKTEDSENNAHVINYDEILKSQEKINQSIQDNMNSNLKEKRPNHKKVNSIMVYYNEYNKRKEWPKKSSINCFWCCHSFNCVPCALPTKLKGDVFHVYGNFCSKECAASYNFESYDANNSQSQWERYSLLNHLYSIIEEDPELKINLAPHRMTLEMFGGSLSIDEFRESFSTTKKYNVVFPPMVSIIPAIEESNKVDNSKRNESYYIPIDKERIKKVNNDLRLKRRNPINNKNTLENCMRLKYT
jgi:hypothetical protein